LPLAAQATTWVLLQKVQDLQMLPVVVGQSSPAMATLLKQIDNKTQVGVGQPEGGTMCVDGLAMCGYNTVSLSILF
jgi:hypothetical protein